MTVDDENSIYVGGLPYDATEETLRRVFFEYGFIVAVKIINDRGTGGKCYGFVTFKNPRSATNAIDAMDGRTIDGRVVKVNEVKTRGGRANVNREGFQHNLETCQDWHRDRITRRDCGHQRGQIRKRNRDSSWDRDRERACNRSQDSNRTKDSRHHHARYHESQRGDHISNRDQDERKDLNGNQQELYSDRDHDCERNPDMDHNPDREMDRTDVHEKVGNEHKIQLSRKSNRSSFSDHHSREISSDSNGGYQGQMKMQLELSIQRRDELQNEISRMGETLEDTQQLIMDLQKNSQKLEAALTSRKKLSSQRHMQLTKLHKCLLQVNDCSRQLKSCEHELQTLVDTTMMDVDMDKVAG